jgi:hypothetical protein
MASNPSLAVKLFGTEEPAIEPKVLRAAELTAELDGGNLRHIRVGDVEVMRAISFIVRDKDWGTYNPIITDLDIKETPDRFSVTYNAVAKDSRQEFRYRAVIEGSGDRIVFRGSGEAVTDFLTNRTGFVVLHPVQGVAGEPVEIEHVDGRVVKGRFPALIDPVQPMMDLRALTHDAARGLRVICRMEGDTFEMEDQRNWTDASYKTYVRPLALPWPYTLAAGTRIEQTVTLSISGAARSASGQEGVVALTIGDVLGTAPAVGLGLDPDDIASTQENASTLALARPAHVICHYDRRRGHDAATLRDLADTAARLGARPWLEAVVVSVDDFAREIAELGAAVASIGSPFEVVLLSPAPDLKCTLPGSVWPPAPPPDAMFRAARKAFPGAKIGGGMFSFFTELNRKRPPVAELDLVSFTTAALVHAGDDRSVMEGLESLPAIASSARAIAEGLPLAVGPSAIGLRMNPYGAAPMENPQNIRQAMNRNDPRQRGLVGAAWTIGYYAHFARFGFTAVAFGGTTGPFGLLHAPQSWPQPWYETKGGTFPVFHAIRLLSAASGKPLRALEVSNPSAVQGICVDVAAGRELVLANLRPHKQQLRLPRAAAGALVLDADRFTDAADDPQFTDKAPTAAAGSDLVLGPYALARIRLA